MFRQHKQHEPQKSPVAPASPAAKRYVEQAEEAVPASIENTGAGSGQQAATARIEDYLDHVVAQLLALPRERRIEIRDELRQHLQAIAAAHEELGDAPDAAAAAALSKFGDPTRIGREFARTWRAALFSEDRTAFPAAAMKQGLLWFGAAGVLFLAFAAILPNWSSWLMDAVWKPVFVALPLAAGWRTGSAAPARSGLGAFYALATLTFATLPVSMLIFWFTDAPLVEHTVLISLMLAAWTPLGCFSAAVSGALRRWRPARFRTVR